MYELEDSALPSDLYPMVMDALHEVFQEDESDIAVDSFENALLPIRFYGTEEGFIAVIREYKGEVIRIALPSITDNFDEEDLEKARDRLISTGEPIIAALPPKLAQKTFDLFDFNQHSMYWLDGVTLGLMFEEQYHAVTWDVEGRDVERDYDFPAIFEDDSLIYPDFEVDVLSDCIYTEADDFGNEGKRVVLCNRKFIEFLIDCIVEKVADTKLYMKDNEIIDALENSYCASLKTQIASLSKMIDVEPKKTMMESLRSDRISKTTITKNQRVVEDISESLSENNSGSMFQETTGSQIEE